MDNEMGNSESTFFDALAESEEQVTERKEAEGRIKDGKKLLEDIIAHWDGKIAALNSVEAIKVDITEKPEIHQKRMAAIQMALEILKEERDYLTTLQD